MYKNHLFSALYFIRCNYDHQLICSTDLCDTLGLIWSPQSNVFVNNQSFTILPLFAVETFVKEMKVNKGMTFSPLDIKEFKEIICVIGLISSLVFFSVQSLVLGRCWALYNCKSIFKVGSNQIEQQDWVKVLLSRLF